MEVRLRFVASATSDPARGVVTPSPTTYRCGNDTFRVAFETQRAYVTMPDGSLVTLSRLDTGGDPEQPRTFSNGRMTFVQETEGTGGPRVLLPVDEWSQLRARFNAEFRMKPASPCAGDVG
jgi:hypothetical protein